jgi:hypothetical protein
MAKSLATWKATHYPVGVYNVAEEDALAHVYQKWLGLKPEVLKEHGLELDLQILTDDAGDKFWVDDESCALCYWHLDQDARYDEDEDEDHHTCGGTCPLERIRGTPCDYPRDSPYFRFFDTGDPEPMLALIRKAIAAEGES